MRCALALCVALASTAACGGMGEETAPPRDREVQPRSEEGKRWGGWRWKGEAEDCFFRLGNRCFDDLQEACKAADCGDRKCVHDDAAPARVSCEGDDPEALDRADPVEAADESEPGGEGEGEGEAEATDESADDEASEAGERERERKRKRRKRRRGRRN